MTEYHFTTPIREEDVRKLRIGDRVFVTGTVVTARDQAHRRALQLLAEGKPLPVDLQGGVIYHCGPVVRRMDDRWEVVAAGPTTSARMESLEYDFIAKTGVRIVVGKGGMGAKTAEAAQKFGAVYCEFIGGVGVLAANAIKEVERVEWLDLGIPEALWVLRVERFGPLIVCIDSTGRNYHQELAESINKRFQEIIQKL
ncbi:fumarate hydratase C-terminal domain-containing protein [archaeon]|nr:fumarate hydratase C-terminal domain-containing protein [archaeon]